MRVRPLNRWKGECHKGRNTGSRRSHAGDNAGSRGRACTPWCGRQLEVANILKEEEVITG